MVGRGRAGAAQAVQRVQGGRMGRRDRRAERAGGKPDRPRPCIQAALAPPPAAVSRIKCRSDLYEMDMILDVNVDVYPVEVGGPGRTGAGRGGQQRALAAAVAAACFCCLAQGAA